jgi:2-iminobutanoate/2-iminopropanoate deaminase
MRTALVLALLAVAPSLHAQQKEMLEVPGTVPGMPFSPAVRVGNVIYLSGSIGAPLGSKELVPGGVRAETRQILANIRAIVEAAGSSLDQVFKCTVFLADIGDYAAMNEEYAAVFRTDPPARSTVAGSGLALGARVEIECLAAAGP